MMLRRLADHAFMLRDYKFANQIYETLKKDLYSPSSLKHLTSTQEMQGLCLLLLDTPKSAEPLLESALSLYKSLGYPHYECRVGVIYHELVKTRVVGEGVIHVLEGMARTGEVGDHGRSAVLFEECAVSYLVGNFRQLRKCAYFFVLAGEHYFKCEQVYFFYIKVILERTCGEMFWECFESV